MPTFRPTTTAALIRETAARLGDQPLEPVHIVLHGPTDPLPGTPPVRDLRDDRSKELNRLDRRPGNSPKLNFIFPAPAKDNPS